MSLIKNYYELCKPNVVLMMLLCALVGIILASDTLLPLIEILVPLVGIGLCSGSAAAINQIIDREADAEMSRTDKRPIPQGEISVTNASIFAFVIGLLGVLILVYFVNSLTAILTIFALGGYAFIYTIFLKRATPQNIVIGGLAGAAPPLLGWTAVTNSVDPNSLLLVLIIFAWTPPHFWALAIHRREDYAKENIPMLPVTHGVQFTKLQIILYTIILILVSLLPFVVLMSGVLYVISSLILGAIFLYYSVRLYFDQDNEHAFPTFVYSIYYIFLIFAALLVDHFLI